MSAPRPSSESSIDAVRNAKINVATPSGNAYVPLTEVADITLDTGASYIFHEKNRAFIPIKFSVRGRDLGGAVAEAKEKIAKAITLPNGYRMIWAGEFEELEQAQKRLCRDGADQHPSDPRPALRLFNSLRDSLLVLTGIPFAVAGGIIALVFSGEAFGISAAIGFVSLFGVSVMNGILIMTYFNEMKARGRQQPGSHVPGSNAKNAPDVDDRAFRLPSGYSPRHFRPGSAARCSVRSPSSSSAEC